MTSPDQIASIHAATGSELSTWQIIEGAAFGYVEAMSGPRDGDERLAMLVLETHPIDGDSSDTTKAYFGLQPGVPEQFLTGLANLYTDSKEDAIALLTMWDVTVRALNSDHGEGCSCGEDDG